MPAKKWPIDRFAELVKYLLKNFPELNILLLGSKDEIEDGKMLHAINPERVMNLSGQLDIIETAEVLSRSKLLVSNDTGTMHLGAAMSVPVVALFSARDNPGKWEPWGGKNIVLRKEVCCSGCFLSQCNNDNMCINLITVEDVIKAINKMLMKGGKI